MPTLQRPAENDAAAAVPSKTGAHEADNGFQAELQQLKDAARDAFEKTRESQLPAGSDPLRLLVRPDAQRIYGSNDRIKEVDVKYPDSDKLAARQNYVQDGEKDVLVSAEILNEQGQSIAKSKYSVDPTTGKPRLDESTEWRFNGATKNKIDVQYGGNSIIKRTKVYQQNALSSIEIQCADPKTLTLTHSDLYDKASGRISSTDYTPNEKRTYLLGPADAFGIQPVLVKDVYDLSGNLRSETIFHGQTKDLVTYPNPQTQSNFLMALGLESQPKSIRNQPIRTPNESIRQPVRYNFGD